MTYTLYKYIIYTCRNIPLVQITRGKLHLQVIWKKLNSVRFSMKKNWNDTTLFQTIYAAVVANLIAEKGSRQYSIYVMKFLIDLKTSFLAIIVDNFNWRKGAIFNEVEKLRVNYEQCVIIRKNTVFHCNFSFFPFSSEKTKINTFYRQSFMFDWNEKKKFRSRFVCILTRGNFLARTNIPSKKKKKSNAPYILPENLENRINVNRRNRSRFLQKKCYHADES